MSAVNSVTLFVFYLALAVVLGLWVGRRNAANPRSYFRAGEGLPWYAIGGSMPARRARGRGRNPVPSCP